MPVFADTRRRRGDSRGAAARRADHPPVCGSRPVIKKRAESDDGRMALLIQAVELVVRRNRQLRDRGSAEKLGSPLARSDEHKSELQSLMRNSYAVFCLKKK